MKFYTIRVHYRDMRLGGEMEATTKPFGLYAKSEEEARELAKRAVEALSNPTSHTEVVDVADSR